jgi:hypothetical protein
MHSQQCFLKINIQLNVPTSTLLSTVMVPPCFSTSCFTIASPSPVPPYRLAEITCACSKISKIESILLAGIPIPVSETLNSIVIFCLVELFTSH